MTHHELWSEGRGEFYDGIKQGDLIQENIGWAETQRTTEKKSTQGKDHREPRQEGV